MLATKIAHHHNSFISSALHCVIDGKDLLNDITHEHKSVSTEYKSQTEECAICQFNILNVN